MQRFPIALICIAGFVFIGHAAPPDHAAVPQPANTPASGWWLILQTDSRDTSAGGSRHDNDIVSPDDPFELLSEPAAGTASVRVKAVVNGTLTTADRRFGGCMASLNTLLQETGLDCPGRWVTFSCIGVHNSREAAARLFAAARTAFRTGRTALLEVTDEKKHHGWCYAARVDVLAR